MSQNQSNSVFSSSIARFPSTSPVRMIVQEPSHDWRKGVVNTLEDLVRLELGWNGYRAEPVSLTNAIFALSMLEAICGPNAPLPQIVPGIAGDLQIEWHKLNGDIELHVKGPNSVHAWRRMVNNAEDEELELTNDFSQVAVWIKEISELNFAAAATAA